jgi:transposase InsO family protein
LKVTAVYFIPKLSSNIISLGQLEEGGCKIVLEAGQLWVFDPEHALLVQAPCRANRLYTVNLTVAAPVFMLARGEDMVRLWHTCYGNLNFWALRELGSKNVVTGLLVIERVEQVCDGCVLGRQHCTPFPQVASYRATRALDLFHADLHGKIAPPTPGGKRYFLLLIDDYSHFMWIELLATKDQAPQMFKKIKVQAETEIGGSLKALRTDRGGEFNSVNFTIYCEELGIKHFTTAPHTPQQNGVVERRNSTIVEMARCLLKGMKVPGEFWGEAVKTAVYILNRSPTHSLEGRTPFEA